MTSWVDGQKPEATQFLEWLADAPLFIDESQIRAFYDAVVRPESRQGITTISVESLFGGKLTVTGKAGVELSPGWLFKLFPFLKAKAQVEGSVEGEGKAEQGKTNTIELLPIDTPQRQLVQLSLHYLANQQQRIRFVSDAYKSDWAEDAFIQALPRAMVFLDFPRSANDRPPVSQFIPMAAEVNDGKVVRLFELLRSHDGRQAPPPYPEQSEDPRQYEASLAAYWEWFQKNFSATHAMRVLEELVASQGRIYWIDFRVPKESFPPLHLHITARQQFDTGVFAYNLIKRGASDGLRIVGTLKSGPDVNVLAIFEK